MRLPTYVDVASVGLTTVFLAIAAIFPNSTVFEVFADQRHGVSWLVAVEPLPGYGAYSVRNAFTGRQYYGCYVNYAEYGCEVVEQPPESPAVGSEK